MTSGARRARQLEYYADSNTIRPNNGAAWTREEEELLMDPGTLTDHQLAELLGRSTHAVDNHRYHLRKKMQ